MSVPGASSVHCPVWNSWQSRTPFLLVRYRPSAPWLSTRLAILWAPFAMELLLLPLPLPAITAGFT
eukprot:5204575-Amphidinium_carterae.1